MGIYRCSLCHVYFENYTKATIHLGMKHSETLRLRIKKSNEEDGDFIKSVDFSDAKIILKREAVFELDYPRTTTAKGFQNSKTKKKTVTFKQEPKITVSTRSTRRNMRSQKEVQQGDAETVDAGKIETLIGTLYNNPTATRTEAIADPNPTVPIPKGNRRVAKAFKNNFYEDYEPEPEEPDDDEFFEDELDEEENGDDFVPATDIDEDYEDQLELDQPRPYRRKSSKRSKSKRKPRSKSQRDDDKEFEATSGDVSNPSKRKTIFNCRVCTAKFGKQRGDYLKHMEDEHLKDGSYTCPHCDLAIFPLEKFTLHIKTHFNSYTASNRRLTPEELEKCTCKICKKVLKHLLQGGMEQHLKTHERKSVEDPTKPFSCPVCQHRFPNRYNLQRHFVLHLENNPFSCQFSGCGRKFNSEYNLKRHASMHVERIYHSCQQCSASFAHDHHLARHIKVYHSGDKSKVYKPRKRSKLTIQIIDELVPEFSIASKTPRLLPSSVKVEMNEDSRFELESVHMADTIVQTEDQDLHIKGEKLSPLPKKRRAATADGSRSNSPSSRSPSPGPSNDNYQNDLSKFEGTQAAICRLIDSDPVVKRLKKTNPDSLAVFIKSRALYNISRTTNDFKCQLCRWSGAKSYAFQKHMQNIHGAEPPRLPSTATENENSEASSVASVLTLNLTCGSCGYQSNSANGLTVHIRKAHATNKKFRCSQCGKGFTSLSGRKLHVKQIHLMQNKFKCNQCGVKYAMKRSLERHLKERHDPEYQKQIAKSYKCGTCGKISVNEQRFRKHLMTHTKEVQPPVSCKICGQSCAAPSSLKRHIQIVHMGVKSPYNKPKSRLSRIQKGSSYSSDQIESGSIEEENRIETDALNNCEVDADADPLDADKATKASRVPDSSENAETDISEILGL